MREADGNLRNYFIVYHGADFDGLFGGVIARKHLLRNCVDPGRITCVPYNYEDRVVYKDEDLVNLVDKDTTVIFIDCMCSIDILKELKEICEKIEVIDHHATALALLFANFEEDDNIDYASSISSSAVIDSGEGVPKSAAMLTWDKYFGNVKVPIALTLISHYDVFHKKDAEYSFDTIISFQYGLRAHMSEYDYHDLVNCYQRVEHVLDDLNETFDIIHNGKQVLDFVKGRNNMIYRTSGGPCTVIINDQSYNALSVSDYGSNSLIFDQTITDMEEYNKYDLFIIFSPVVGTIEAKLTIIGNKNIDAGYICALLGGGGHKAIGGCYCTVSKSEDENGIEYELKMASNKNVISK
ncbi:MAG: hypothetical protein ACRC5M_04395 [Anaeroplasmataceae bacterium]